MSKIKDSIIEVLPEETFKTSLKYWKLETDLNKQDQYSRPNNLGMSWHGEVEQNHNYLLCQYKKPQGSSGKNVILE